MAHIWHILYDSIGKGVVLAIARASYYTQTLKLHMQGHRCSRRKSQLVCTELSNVWP